MKNLFRVYDIPHEKKLANLIQILNDETVSNKAESSLLPSNEDALKYFNSSPTTLDDSSHSEEQMTPPPVELNELCITVWASGWYLGYALEITQSHVHVEHLERVKPDSNLLQRHPTTPEGDKVQVEHCQIIPLKPVIGDWDTSNLRCIVTKLKNIDEIEQFIEMMHNQL